MKTTRRAWGAALALAATAAFGLTACSDGNKTEQSGTAGEQSGVTLEETPTSEGAAMTDAIRNCDGVAEIITAVAPSALDGLQSIVEAFGEGQQTLCEWQSTDGAVVDVQLVPYSQTVPSADQVEDQGGVLLTSNAITEAGGILYAVPVANSPSSVWGVMPYGQVIFQYAGVENAGIDETTAAQIVERLLGV